jgi:hypothetical protein
MPTSDEQAVRQALEASRLALKKAIDLASIRIGTIEGRSRTANESIAAIEAAAAALQLPAAHELPRLISEGIQASATGLQKASDLVNAAGIAVLTGSNVSALDEWKECRVTIDRCDKLLVDLRKTGFGFVTAVVGAAAFVFGRADHGSDLLKSYLLCALVMLIIVLYLVDLAHQSWLMVAVRRAEALEVLLSFRLTQEVSKEFSASRGIGLGSFLYFLLLLTSCVIFWASMPLEIEGPYVAARANVYGAFATGLWVVIAAPLVSGLLSKASNRLALSWWLVGVTAGFAAIAWALWYRGLLRL